MHHDRSWALNFNKLYRHSLNYYIRLALCYFPVYSSLSTFEKTPLNPAQKSFIFTPSNLPPLSTASSSYTLNLNNDQQEPPPSHSASSTFRSLSSPKNRSLHSKREHLSQPVPVSTCRMPKPLISPKNQLSDRLSADRHPASKAQGHRTSRSPHSLACCNHPAKKA